MIGISDFDGAESVDHRVEGDEIIHVTKRFSVSGRNPGRQILEEKEKRAALSIGIELSHLGALHTRRVDRHPGSPEAEIKERNIYETGFVVIKKPEDKTEELVELRQLRAKLRHENRKLRRENNRLKERIQKFKDGIDGIMGE